MMPPPFRADPSDEGIPAADPGPGAPEPASGFGVEAEEPDVVPEEDHETAERTDLSEGTAFRTPDPQELGPETER